MGLRTQGVSAPKLQLGETNSAHPSPPKGIRVEETLQEMLEPFLLPWQAVLQMLSTGQRGLEGEMSKGPVTSEQDKPKASVIA